MNTMVCSSSSSSAFRMWKAAATATAAAAAKSRQTRAFRRVVVCVRNNTRHTFSSSSAPLLPFPIRPDPTTTTTTTTGNRSSSSSSNSIVVDKVDVDALKAEIDVYNQKQLEVLRMVHKMVEMNISTLDNHDDDDDGRGFNREALEPLGYGRIPPAIHREFKSIDFFASGSEADRNSCSYSNMSIDQDLAASVLYKAHLNARSHPWLMGWAMIVDETYQLEETEQIQRWQGEWRRNIVAAFHKYSTSNNNSNNKSYWQPGDIIDTDPVTGQSLVVQYHRDLRTHFGNAPPFATTTTTTTPTASGKKAAAMTMGTTHVALGFNDLQVLLEAGIVVNSDDGDGDATTTTTKKKTTHRFIGYDRSTFSVAKGLVLADMLQSPHASSAEHVIQAWYSSTWSCETAEAFATSCVTVLTQRQRAAVVAAATTPTTAAAAASTSTTTSTAVSSEDEINGYLHHWMTTHNNNKKKETPMAAGDAIRQWFLESCHDRCAHVYTRTCSFRRKRDRLALLTYFMTGEFGHGSDNSERVGSLAMWIAPDWAPAPNKSDQDRVTHTVLFQAIMDELVNNNNDDDNDSDDATATSVMDAIYNIKLKQVRRLQQLVKSGRLEIDLRYGDIQPLNDDAGGMMCENELASEIQLLSPSTMSWSNLLDYFDLRQLHELAKFWSKSGGMTTHYGYTMNWPMTCYGTAISDYPSVAERKRILEDSIGKRVVATAKKTGASKFLSVPPFEHTEELTGESLAHAMRPAWVSYFRNAARESSAGDDNDHDFGNITLKDEIPLGWPAARSNRSIYLTWKYSA